VHTYFQKEELKKIIKQPDVGDEIERYEVTTREGDKEYPFKMEIRTE